MARARVILKNSINVGSTPTTDTTCVSFHFLSSFSLFFSDLLWAEYNLMTNRKATVDSLERQA